MRTHRGSRAAYLTTCPDCMKDVGVTRDIFNRHDLGSEHVWRTTTHQRDQVTDKSRCTGSRIVVPEVGVWAREAQSA